MLRLNFRSKKLWLVVREFDGFTIYHLTQTYMFPSLVSYVLLASSARWSFYLRMICQYLGTQSHILLLLPLDLYITLPLPALLSSVLILFFGL